MCIAATASATVLDFNISGMDQNGVFDNDHSAYNYYGDQVASAGTRDDWVKRNAANSFEWVELTSTYAEGDTPNIEVFYLSDNWSQYADGAWNTSDLSNTLYDNHSTSGTGYFVGFQAEPGYPVVIESFDMAYWGSDQAIDDVFITDGTTKVWSSGSVTIEGDTHTSFTPNFVGTDSSAEYWIGFETPSAAIYNFCADNINFSQVVDSDPTDPDALPASNPRPTNGEEGVSLDTQLRWDTGISPAYGRAIEHHVYFGTDEDAVADANTSSSEYMGIVTEVGPSAATPVTVLNPSFETNVLADDRFIAREPNDWDAWVGGIHYVYNPLGDGSSVFDSAVPDDDNVVQVGDLAVDPNVSGFYQYVPVPGGLQAGEIYTMSVKHAGLSSGFGPLKVGIDFCASISLAEYWQPTMLVTNYDNRAADDRDWKEFSAVLDVDALGAAGLAGVSAGFSAGLAGWPTVDPSFYDDVTITVSTYNDPEYDPTLLNETEYFWRIDEVYDTGGGTAIRKGTVWSFTTPKCGQPGQYYDQSDINQDCYTNLGDLALVAAAWLDCRDPANPACAPWEGP